MMRAKNLEEVLALIEKAEGVVEHPDNCTCLGCTIKPAIKEAIDMSKGVT